MGCYLHKAKLHPGADEVEVLTVDGMQDVVDNLTFLDLMAT